MFTELLVSVTFFPPSIFSKQYHHATKAVFAPPPPNLVFDNNEVLTHTLVDRRRQLVLEQQGSFGVLTNTFIAQSLIILAGPRQNCFLMI